MPTQRGTAAPPPDSPLEYKIRKNLDDELIVIYHYHSEYSHSRYDTLY
jgi:hypothetical protein